MSSEPQHVPRPSIDPLLVQAILASQPFVRSQRLCRFLTLLVERANHPDPNGLKETEIGVLVFDRPVGYDPKIDSIVRTEASRLRKKLSEYYANEGRNAACRLHLPPGRYELELLPHTHPVPLGSEAQPEVRRVSRGWLWPAIGIAAAALALLVWFLQPRALRAPSVTPFTFFPGVETSPSFSPDGKHIAYTWDGGNNGPPAVYVQALGSQSPLRLTHSSDTEYSPVWSPDGTQIAFLHRISPDVVEVRRILSHGGTDTLICSMRSTRGHGNPGLSWSPDSLWLVTASPAILNGPASIVLISTRTGEQKTFRPASEATSFYWPAFSPDGHNIAYIRSSEIAVQDVFMSSFPEGRERQITFDHALVHGAAWNGPAELIVSSQRGGQRSTLWRIPIGGAPVRLTEPSEFSVTPAISPDRSILAFSRAAENINVWRRKLDSTNPGDSGAPWLESSGLNSSPQFSSDGKRVAFRSSRSGPSEIWIADRDGGNARKLTNFGGAVTGSPRWSPDGNWIAFDSRASGNSDIWVIAAEGGAPRRLTPESTNEYLPSWSRDGRFIYYTSESGRARAIWRRPRQGGAPELVRDQAVGAWESPDGRYLYYVHSVTEAGLFRVPLSGGAEETVIADLSPGMWGSWAFGRNGIYFVDWISTAGGRQAWAQFQDTEGVRRKLFPISHPVTFDGSVAVSPDESWFAYSQLDRSGSDILLMRDWH